MRKEENDCIRYLMKEMDPSEELLMEREMMENEDLLIEVESMRQTLQKLDKLPRRDPPSEVTESIMKKAAEQAEKNRESQKKPVSVLKYAVAATLLLTVTAGGMWMYIGNGSNASAGNQDASAPSVASTTAPAPSTPAVADIQFNGNNNSSGQALEAAGDQTTIEPWVDRNNILRFEDQFSTQNAEFRNIVRNATQKLQPIENAAPGTNRVNSLQLTGSGN